MSIYTKLKIALTIILSVITSFLCYTYLKSLSDDTTIVIAAKDINPHTLIEPEMIQEVKISKKDKDLLAKDAITSKSELDNAISYVKIEKGQTLHKNIDVINGSKEELINKKAMLENGKVNDEYFISDNKRITTITLDVQGAVGDKLNIGDYVDVIFSQIGDEKSSFTSAIMQHIEIYDIESSGDSEKNISLVVTPQQAVDITYAKRLGKIDLVLNSLNGNSESVVPSSLNRILEIK